MSAAELKAAITLSLVFFLRMLPLFMLLPVLALAGEQYSQTSPQLLGLALGIYGLTQAGLQIPFGILSDRFGRKPIIAAGLCIFILGSLLAALSDSVYGLILGRALQGAGAVAAAIMALAADLTREQVRTKAMACIGISIGASFSVAFVLGPLLFTQIGLDGLFYLGAVFGIAAIVTLYIAVPEPYSEPGKNNNSSTIKLDDLKSVFVNRYLLKLDFSIFTSHLILMANFVVIPIALRDYAELAATSHWQVYLAVIFLSLFIMVPFIIFGERLNKTKQFFMCSIGLIILSQIGLIVLHAELKYIVILMVLFFGAFNYLEALLPSEVSKAIEPDKKGTALGIYSTSQFIGIFIGGLIGGYLHQNFGIAAVYSFCLIMAVLWLMASVLISQNENQLKNKLEEEAV